MGKNLAPDAWHLVPALTLTFPIAADKIQGRWEDPAAGFFTKLKFSSH